MGETFDLVIIHRVEVAIPRPSPGASERALVTAFWLSLGVIFVAELGDKSQLMAMTFATRFRPRQVLIGITAATALVHLASVALGAIAGAALPTRPINIIAGLVFFGFAAWTLRGDSLDDEERNKAARATGSAVLAVGGAFFLAELGDKTMLATVTLAAQDTGWAAWTGIWLGSTVGMVAADALAIVVGGMLARRLPDGVIRIGAAIGFAIFGALLLSEGLTS